MSSTKTTYSVPTTENIWLTVPASASRSDIPSELYLQAWKKFPSKTVKGVKYPATVAFTNNGIIAYVDEKLVKTWDLIEGGWIVVHPAMYQAPATGAGTVKYADLKLA